MISATYANILTSLHSSIAHAIPSLRKERSPTATANAVETLNLKPEIRNSNSETNYKSKLPNVLNGLKH